MRGCSHILLGDLDRLGFRERGLYGHGPGEPRILCGRDCNDDSGREHQYFVWDGVPWHRHVDASADPASGWELYAVPPGHRTEVVAWLESSGWSRRASTSTIPEYSRRHIDLYGDGGRDRDCWAMPPRSPFDPWAAVTDAPCPVAGCSHTLIWAEAGSVPGARVCMARLGDGYDPRTSRHRFLLHGGRLCREQEAE